MAKHSIEAFQFWMKGNLKKKFKKKAKQENDFKIFLPALKKWISLKKEIAKCYDLNKNLYEICIDEYDQGMSLEKLDNLFKNIKDFLIPFIEKVEKSDKKIDVSFLSGKINF
jgi:carboxypeptidase Taq